MSARLPARYARWAADLLEGPLEDERAATCDDCAMCVKPDGRVPTASYFFDPDKKCCSYQPTLANFLVGEILRDPDPRAAFGQESVRARIAARAAVSPLGLFRPVAYALHYDNTVESLGRSSRLRCPHFAPDGTCGVWAHRDAVCATYFCKHDRGWIGGEFWAALQDVFNLVDHGLARWAALELGVDPAVVATRVPREGSGLPWRRPTGRELDGDVDDGTWAERWGAWSGREVDFYVACAEHVGAIGWADVTRRLGPEVQALAGVARRAHGRTRDADTIPGALRLGAFQIVAHRPDGVRCVTYSASDAIDLPTALLPLLPRFDGRQTKIVIDELAQQHGVSIAPDLFRRLVDWGVLVPA